VLITDDLLEELAAANNALGASRNDVELKDKEIALLKELLSGTVFCDVVGRMCNYHNREGWR